MVEKPSFIVLEGEEARVFLAQTPGSRSKYRGVMNAIVAAVGTEHVVMVPVSSPEEVNKVVGTISRLLRDQKYRLHSRSKDGKLALWAEPRT